MGDLSPHFSRSEFRDHSTGALEGPSEALLELLERIRHEAGDKPLRIVSGYRTQAHNRAVGGARRSYHLTGRAADFEPGAVTIRQAVAAGAGGIGWCGQWAVHVDDRRRPSSGAPVMFQDCPKGS